MAEFKQIEQAYQRLFKAFKSTKKMPANEQLQEFANLLPADAESRKKVLGDIIKAGDRRFYRSFTTALEDFAKNTAENQTDNPPKKDENTVSSPKKTQNSGKKDPQSTGENDTTKPKKKDSPETTLTDDARMQKLAALQQVYAEALNAPETIKNQQRELKNIRHDRVFADKPLNKSEEKYAEQIRSLVVGAGVNLDGISAEEILLTCRKAVEEKALQIFRDRFKATLTPEKVKEIEQQMRAFDIRPRVKGKTITLSDDEISKRKEAQKAFVKELQTSFVKEQGYALWGGNGNILKAVREAIGDYKKENGLTRDKDDRKKDDTRGKKTKKEGDRDMADKEMELTEALKKYKDAFGIAQADKPDESANKQMYAALDIMLNDSKASADYKKAYEALMKAETEKLKKAIETLDDGEFKDGVSGALYAHKNRDKFREAGIPEEEWAEITSKEIFEQKKAALDRNPLKPRENTPNPPAPPTNEQADWVKEKAEWYTKYNDEKHLTDFNITRADNQFEVKFEGGTITYESKENVAISPGASYKVYEVLLREDHNKDRPVQFPANASEHLTSMLYAASILNETGEGKPHEMLGVDKEKIKMDLIEQQLRAAGYGDAEIKKVKDYYDTHEGKEADSDTRGAENMPTRPEVKQMAEDNNYTIAKNDVGHVVINGLNNEGEETFQMDYNPADGKYSYSTPETAEPLADIEDQDAVFLKGKADSFIKIQDHLQTQVELAKKEAGGATLDDAEKQQQTDTRIALVEAYSKDPALFRRAMGGLIGNTSVKDDEHTDLRNAQIAMLRAKAEKNGTLKAREEKEAARTERLLVLHGIKSNEDGKILDHKGKKPVKTNEVAAKELSENLQEFTAAKAKNKDLSLKDFMTEKYQKKGLNEQQIDVKIYTQSKYNKLVDDYKKSQTTR